MRFYPYKKGVGAEKVDYPNCCFHGKENMFHFSHAGGGGGARAQQVSR